MMCSFALALLVVPIGGTSAAVPGLSFTETGCEGHSDSVARLYTAGLGRRPEQPGFEFWLGEYSSGRWSLPRMATFFTQSNEFSSLYGNLDHEGFVRQLYRNVLGREGEDGGVAYWTGQLNTAQTRGGVLLRFAESPENIASSGTAQPLLGAFNDGLPGRWTCVVPPTQPPPPGNPGDSKNCSDFATQAEAQAWFDTYYPTYGDIANLDADNNRLACESLAGPTVAAPGQSTTTNPPPAAPPPTTPPSTTTTTTAPTTTVVPTTTTTTASACNSNYSGCVPIASDVDCLGGSGNGPAYVAGPVQVIGTDVYDLDGDSDGVGCE